MAEQKFTQCPLKGISDEELDIFLERAAERALAKFKEHIGDRVLKNLTWIVAVVIASVYGYLKGSGMFG